MSVEYNMNLLGEDDDDLLGDDGPPYVERREPMFNAQIPLRTLMALVYEAGVHKDKHRFHELQKGLGEMSYCNYRRLR